MIDKTTPTTTSPAKTEGTPRPVDPFARFRQMETEMDRWLDAFWPFARRAWATPTVATLPSTATWTPRMDVYQKDGNLMITAELPGLKPDEVEVTVEDGDLIIKGERKAEREVKEKDYYRMERSYGEFYRRQPLPEGIKPEQISATFADGVLHVTIPMPPEPKAPTHKVTVDTN